jgi:hypothetical protein
MLTRLITRPNRLSDCRPRTSAAARRFLVCIALVVFLSGCARARPAPRVGALPFPGPFNLYSGADVNDLGNHEFGTNKRLYWSGESRGIVYTCRAGFLDLAHIRDTVDMAWYAHRVMSEAVAEGRTTVVVRGIDPSRHHITLNLPEVWRARSWHPLNTRPPELDAALVDTALRLAWIATTWHEIITWYGYKSTGFIPEDRSAFTYDDTISHAVGLVIAQRVLEMQITDVDAFNERVTAILEEVLADLEVVSPDETNQAVRLVEGSWWEGMRAKKLYLDIGMDTGRITPWLVRDLDVCRHAEPRVFDVPRLIDDLRPDGQPFANFKISPRIWESRAIRASIPGAPKRIVPHRDFPHIMAHIRRESIDTLGDDFDRPE